MWRSLQLLKSSGKAGYGETKLKRFVPFCAVAPRNFDVARCFHVRYVSDIEEPLALHKDNRNKEAAMVKETHAEYLS